MPVMIEMAASIEAPVVVESASKLPARKAVIEAAAKSRTGESTAHVAAEAAAHVTTTPAEPAATVPAPAATAASSSARKGIGRQSARESGSNGQDDHRFTHHETTPLDAMRVRFD
jgi:hypothetical protein